MIPVARRNGRDAAGVAGGFAGEPSAGSPRVGSNLVSFT
jgi:hypothetical protein